MISSNLLAVLEGASLAGPSLTALALLSPVPALRGAWRRLRDGEPANKLPEFASKLSARLLWFAVMLAGMMCMPWLVLLRRAGSVTPSELGFAWDYIWLPVLPLLISFGGQLVDWALKGTAAEVEGLGHLTYNFKKV